MRDSEVRGGASPKLGTLRMPRDTKVLQEDAYKSSDGSVQGLVCKACLTRRQKASRATRWYGEFTVCGFSGMASAPHWTILWGGTGNADR